MFLCLLFLLNLLCLGSPFHKLQVRGSHCFWCLPLVAKVGSVGCVGFLVEGTSACVLVDEAGSCLSGGRSTSGGVFWGVCDLIMILGSLSINGWCRVPVLLVVWHRVSSIVAYWSLSGAGSWRWDGDLWEIFAVWYYVQLGGLWWTNVLKLALPPHRHCPDARLEHQEPVIRMAQNKREKKKERKR